MSIRDSATRVRWTTSRAAVLLLLAACQDSSSASDVSAPPVPAPEAPPTGVTSAQLIAAARRLPAMPRSSEELLRLTGRREFTFASGTPYNDIEYTAFDTDYMEGETNGYDTFIPADPGDPLPGSNRIRLIRAVNNLDLEASYDGARGDRIVLGSAEGSAPFFLKGSDGVDNDYAVIQNYDYRAGHIQLRGSAAEYRVVYATAADSVATEGHYLFRVTGGDIDLIAFIFPCDQPGETIGGTPPRSPALLCNSSRRIALDDGVNFRFDAGASGAPAFGHTGSAQFGTTGRDLVGGLAVDGVGNSYLVGATDGRQSSGATSDNTLFIAQRRPDGSAGWRFELAASDGTLLFDATTDDEYLYAVGRTLGALPGFTNAGRWDAIILKLRLSTGALVASHQFGNAGLDGYGNVVLDDAGHLYVSGAGSPSGATGTDDQFLVAKYSAATLAPLWRVIERPDVATRVFVAEAWGGLTYARGARPGDGRLVAGGWFMTAGGADAFLTVYERLNDAAPVRAANATISTPGQQADWVLDNDVDADGNIVAVGFTTGTLPGVTGLPGMTNPTRSAFGEGDAFVVRFDAQLRNPRYVQIGSSRSDMFRRVAIDSTGVVHAVGHSYGTLPGSVRANADSRAQTGDVAVVSFDRDLRVLRVAQFGSPREDRGVLALWRDRLVVGGMTEGALAGASLGSFDAFVLSLGRDDLQPR
jgi:hypothetical protein